MLSSGERKLRRGDVVRVRFDPVEGSEQAGERPALVLSPEILNRGGIIVVAAITSKKTEDVYPWEHLLEAGEGGLSMRSKVLFRHLRGVSKSRITGLYGSVDTDVMEHADEALKLAVGLIKV